MRAIRSNWPFAGFLACFCVVVSRGHGAEGKETHDEVGKAACVRGAGCEPIDRTLSALDSVLDADDLARRCGRGICARLDASAMRSVKCRAEDTLVRDAANHATFICAAPPVARLA
jgi:hypothetical protein